MRHTTKVSARDNHLHLLWVLAKIDFKLRYHGSVLGYVWSLLKPLLLFAVLYVVFSIFMRWNIQHYQLYLLLGIILWNFFAEGTMAGLSSLVAKADIIKKIYFPRILIVLASTVSALLTLLLNIVIFFVFYFLNGLGLHWWMLLFLLYLAVLYLFVVGISLLLSVLQARYRDIVQIWEVTLQAGFFMTPVIYPLQVIPEQYWWYLSLNPLTSIIQYSRLLLIHSQLPTLLATVYVTTGMLMIGFISLLAFNKLSKDIAEKI